MKPGSVVVDLAAEAGGNPSLRCSEPLLYLVLTYAVLISGNCEVCKPHETYSYGQVSHLDDERSCPCIGSCVYPSGTARDVSCINVAHCVLNRLGP